MAEEFPAWIAHDDVHKGTGKTQPPTGAVIELIERDRTPDDTTGGSVVIPNEVRINGQPVLVPDDKPITVHEISAGGLVSVTLTLFARRISIRAEHDPD
jgi:hypothetical protein